MTLREDGKRNKTIRTVSRCGGEKSPKGEHGSLVTALGTQSAPDVSTGLWTSESGIPADPPAASLTSISAGRRGWSSNLIPRMNPIMIPRVNPLTEATVRADDLRIDYSV